MIEVRSITPESIDELLAGLRPIDRLEMDCMMPDDQRAGLIRMAEKARRSRAAYIGGDLVGIFGVSAGGILSNTGARSAASVEGADSVAMASGYQGKAKACAGSAIVLCYRDDDFKLVRIRSAIAGQDGVKPDTWYRLGADGTFIEVSDDQE